MNKQVKLLKANFEDLQMIWKMQVEAFSELYEKYHDTETSPATEKIDKIIWRFNQPETTYYFILADGEKELTFLKKNGIIPMISKRGDFIEEITEIYERLRQGMCSGTAV